MPSPFRAEPGLLRSLTTPGFLRRRSFRDVVVMPIESFHEGAMFRGGPLWPSYPWQVRARTSRGLLPLPRDARPSRVAPPERVIETATWVGPVSHHFGHAVADFSTRLAASANADPTQPLLFAVWPEVAPEPPPFFWQMLAHFGVDPARVILADRPVLVRELHVFPQAERRGAAPPPAAYLDYLDRVGRTPAAPAGQGGSPERVYVSRARLQAHSPRYMVGQLAGESYLEGLLAGAGVAVVHPEELTLAEQLALYRGAKLLLFAEGSALHGLQLLGRIDAEVAVINRRRGSRLAASAIKPRVRALRYVRAIRGVIRGLMPDGRPDRIRGIAVLEPSRLTRQLADLGLDLTPAWDRDAYLAQRDRDIEAWITATVARRLHPDARAAIDASLARLVR